VLVYLDGVGQAFSLRALAVCGVGVGEVAGLAVRAVVCGAGGEAHL
jgi:hypothetical protein